MLEVRYNKTTKEVTGWWGNRHGNLDVKLRNRPNETITYIDIDVPAEPLEAFLCTDTELVSNPDYVPRLLPRDLAAEVTELRKIEDRVVHLEDLAGISGPTGPIIEE